MRALTMDELSFVSGGFGLEGEPPRTPEFVTVTGQRRKPWDQSLETLDQIQWFSEGADRRASICSQVASDYEERATNIQSLVAAGAVAGSVGALGLGVATVPALVPIPPQARLVGLIAGGVGSLGAGAAAALVFDMTAENAAARRFYHDNGCSAGPGWSIS
jgi:hypothetical protein